MVDSKQNILGFFREDIDLKDSSPAYHHTLPLIPSSHHGYRVENSTISSGQVMPTETHNVTKIIDFGMY